MARVTAALGKIARDVTLLAQTEVAEVAEGAAAQQPGAAPRRGGSSAMPNKNNPVAAVAVLGCTKQVPGLLATLVASAEQEHQRAAGCLARRVAAVQRHPPAGRLGGGVGE